MKQKKDKPLITFLIFAFNEAYRIKYPIRCFRNFGRVIVVDNFSSDKTKEISLKEGAEVIQYKNIGWVETKEETDFILKQLSTEWVYWGFADEMVPQSCLKLYLKIASENKYKIVYQKKKTVLYTPFDEYTPNYVDLKLFKVGAVDFTNNTIHQMGKFAKEVKQSEVLYLPPIDEYSVFHFSRYNTESVINAFNRYSSIHAATTSKKFIRARIIVEPFITFLSIYLFQRSFLYGIKGFIVAMHFTMYNFLVTAKTYELKHSITLESIENEFVKEKIRLLKESPKSDPIKKTVAMGKKFLVEKLHRKKKFG